MADSDTRSRPRGRGGSRRALGGEKENKIFVSKLPDGTTSKDLMDLFKIYQPIACDVVARKGWGFISVKKPQDVQKACEELHDTEYKGEKLIVVKSESTRKTGLPRREGRDNMDEEIERLKSELTRHQRRQLREIIRAKQIAFRSLNRFNGPPMGFNDRFDDIPPMFNNFGGNNYDDMMIDDNLMNDNMMMMNNRNDFKPPFNENSQFSDVVPPRPIIDEIIPPKPLIPTRGGGFDDVPKPLLGGNRNFDRSDNIRPLFNNDDSRSSATGFNRGDDWRIGGGTSTNDIVPPVVSNSRWDNNTPSLFDRRVGGGDNFDAPSRNNFNEGGRFGTSAVFDNNSAGNSRSGFGGGFDGGRSPFEGGSGRNAFDSGRNAFDGGNARNAFDGVGGRGAFDEGTGRGGFDGGSGRGGFDGGSGRGGFDGVSAFDGGIGRGGFDSGRSGTSTGGSGLGGGNNKATPLFERRSGGGAATSTGGNGSGIASLFDTFNSGNNGGNFRGGNDSSMNSRSNNDNFGSRFGGGSSGGGGGSFWQSGGGSSMNSRRNY